MANIVIENVLKTRNDRSKLSEKRRGETYMPIAYASPMADEGRRHERERQIYTRQDLLNKPKKSRMNYIDQLKRNP